METAESTSQTKKEGWISGQEPLNPYKIVYSVKLFNTGGLKFTHADLSTLGSPWILKPEVEGLAQDSPGSPSVAHGAFSSSRTVNIIASLSSATCSRLCLLSTVLLDL